MADVIYKYFSEFTAEQQQQFNALEPLYKEWNEKINVISRKDIDGLYLKHVLHSLSIAAMFDFAEGTQVLDIGTGGGFPSIPLAIYFPQVHFLLADSIAKKLKVAAAVASSINLKNVTLQHTRAEEIKDRKFDAVLSRGVAPLKDLWKWAKPLLKKHHVQSNGDEKQPNGLICLKGGDLAQEIYESGLHPHQISIENIFKEDYFKEKFILYQPLR